VVKSAGHEIETRLESGEPDRTIVRFVKETGLVPTGTVPQFERLPGGVSSDIWLVRAGESIFCVKKALSKLRVASDWRAPVGRNANEAAWFKVVSAFMPNCAPSVLAEDADSGIFAMQYLPEQSHPNWKAQLQHGSVDAGTADAVGQCLACIHSTTAKSPLLAARFATDQIFHDIRLEPYLLATARVHPGLADRLEFLARSTAQSKLVLVHGDVSPKNILVGPRGPVFLDAECAWWGDPAFDVAFCLNHLMLKCLWVPNARRRLMQAFGTLVARYLAGVDWESVESIDRRIARLLPGLLLARVDGKSPVEYLTEHDKDRVRRVATALLAEPPDRLADVAEAWDEELNCKVKE
jgi:aminoglycoside phosphotransferase (APT) family kinase protein